MHSSLKAWILVKTLSSLARNWNSDWQVFSPLFFSLYFTVTFFKRNGYLQALS